MHPDDLDEPPERPPRPEGMTTEEWFETPKYIEYKQARRAWKMAKKKKKRAARKPAKKRKATKKLVAPRKPDGMSDEEWEQSPRYQKYLAVKAAWEEKVGAHESEDAPSRKRPRKKKRKSTMKRDIFDEELD